GGPCGGGSGSRVHHHASSGGGESRGRGGGSASWVGTFASWDRGSVPNGSRAACDTGCVTSSTLSQALPPRRSSATIHRRKQRSRRHSRAQVRVEATSHSNRPSSAAAKANSSASTLV